MSRHTPPECPPPGSCPLTIKMPSTSSKEIPDFPSTRRHKLTTFSANPVFRTHPFLSKEHHLPTRQILTEYTVCIRRRQRNNGKTRHYPCTHSPVYDPASSHGGAKMPSPHPLPHPLGMACRHFLELTLRFTPSFPVLLHPSPYQLRWHSATAT